MWVEVQTKHSDFLRVESEGADRPGQIHQGVELKRRGGIHLRVPGCPSFPSTDPDKRSLPAAALRRCYWRTWLKAWEPSHLSPEEPRSRCLLPSGVLPRPPVVRAQAAGPQRRLSTVRFWVITLSCIPQISNCFFPPCHPPPCPIDNHCLPLVLYFQVLHISKVGF